MSKREPPPEITVTKHADWEKPAPSARPLFPCRAPRPQGRTFEVSNAPGGRPPAPPRTPPLPPDPPRRRYVVVP